MAKRKRPRRETRYQRIQRLIRERRCGLLSLDLSCSCPKQSGPEQPHVEHPGKAGFLTCNGCRFNAGVLFDSRVCTHPNAGRTAARQLADAIRNWEQQQAAQQQLF